MRWINDTELEVPVVQARIRVREDLPLRLSQLGFIIILLPADLFPFCDGLPDLVVAEAGESFEQLSFELHLTGRLALLQFGPVPFDELAQLIVRRGNREDR